MADKTLKLKATFDVAEVGKGADKAVKEINRVAAAGETAAVKAERKHEKQIRGLGTIERYTGLIGVEGTINMLRSLPALLAEVGAVGIAAGAGILAALVPIYIAVSRFRELLAIRKEIQEASFGDVEASARNLHGFVAKAMESGTINKGYARDVQARIAASKARADEARGTRDAFTSNVVDVATDKIDNIGSKLHGAFGYMPRMLSTMVGMSKAGLSPLLNLLADAKYNSALKAEDKIQRALLEEVKKNLRAEAATRASAAEMAAADELQISKKGFDYRDALLKESLDRGLISQQTYYAETSKLIEQEAAEQQAALAVREQNLRAQLAREKDDLNARAKTQAELNQVLNQEELARLDAINKKEAARIARDASIMSVHKFTLAPTGADELSKLGLFRGGAGDNFPSLQLNELKVISRKLDDHSVILRTR